jgi:hypothetical protein
MSRIFIEPLFTNPASSILMRRIEICDRAQIISTILEIFLEATMSAELIDRIYESCFVPEVWPEVLETLGSIGDTTGASFFLFKKEAQFCVASREPRERAELVIKEGWTSRGQIIPRLLAQHYAGFLIDVDVFTPEELAQEPLYRDFWRPRGIGSAMGTLVPIPTGEQIAFLLSRSADRGPFNHAAAQRLDALRPHLARSALISARLQLERARIVSQTLAIMGIPALVFDEQGKVLAANSLIESKSDIIHWRAFDRVSLRDRRADQMLRDAIAGLKIESGSSVRSFPVHDIDGSSFIAHVIPIRLSARDIFVRSSRTALPHHQP